VYVDFQHIQYLSIVSRIARFFPELNVTVATSHS